MSYRNLHYITVLSLDNAFQVLLSGLKKISNMTVISDNIITHKIKIRAKMSLWSWGENIQLNLSKIDDNLTNINIESDTIAPQIYEWGKNKRNIEKIIEILKDKQQVL